ncbi:hypothetical protein C8R44DRAFT_988091 [Mycena epipterygia]|nr:hypothetical protein C8R44DRAFT_988091 [Mycena epipterygia]
MPSVFFSPLPLDNSLGAVYIGVVISSAIYGLTCLQTYRYFQLQVKDSALLKGCVILPRTIETLHSACIAHAVYFYSVSNYGDYLPLLRAVWSIILPAGLNSLTGSIVQMCFAWRVYAMSNKNKPLVILIGLLATFQLAVAWAATGLGFKYRVFFDLGHNKALVVTSLTSTAATNILLALSLCYYLNYKSDIKSTGSWIDKLIIYAINCGILFSLIAVLGLITFLTMPNNLVNFAVNFVLAKTYSNSLLSSLNARSTLHTAHHGAIALEFLESQPAFAPQQPESGVTAMTVTQSNVGNESGKYTQEYKVDRGM